MAGDAETSGGGSADSGSVATTSCMRRRDAFVVEVANTIDARHGEGPDSFVFGLSGRWGEGKTHFLGQMKPMLEERGFRVITLNPWKYSGDRTAFLRSFLVELVITQSWSSRLATAWRCFRRFRLSAGLSVLTPRRTIASIRTDTSRQRVDWVRLLFMLGVALLALWFVWAQFEARNWSLSVFWRWTLVVVMVPVLVALVQNSLRNQVTTRAASAMDEFDDLLERFLASGGGVHIPKQRVVVFVDDLDRVTAEVQRGVLDNLRTFFDKPELSFIVTGDYVVLESSLGRDLEPGRDTAGREQGRLFLKKIFNVYWRLPLPVQSDFQAFVDVQIKARGGELTSLVAEPEQIAQLRELLLGFSDLNLRQVVRMLDSLLFCLRLVRAQLENAADDSERDSLKEMIDAPLLLARVLVIQDRCAPLFDRLVERPSLLGDLDRAVAEAMESGSDAVASDAVATFLDSPAMAGCDLTDPQTEFLTRFAYIRPLFYDLSKGGQVVRDFGPWIHLAGDASFSDASGPRPGDFARTVLSQNREGLAAQMARCSEGAAEPAASAAVEALRAIPNAEERAPALGALMAVCGDGSPDDALVVASVDGVCRAIEPLTEGMQDATRVPMLLEVAQVADRGTDRLDLDSPPWAFRSVADLRHAPAQPYGGLAGQVVMRWLVSYYEQNPADCLGYLNTLLPQVGQETRGSASDLGRRLAGDILNDRDPGRMTLRLSLTTDHFPESGDLAAELVLAQISQPDMWDWSLQRVSDGTAPWTAADMHQALVDWVVGASSDSELVSRLAYCVGKADSSSAPLWHRLAQERREWLTSMLDTLVSQTNLAPLVVPTDVSSSLYVERASEVQATDDEPLAIQRAQALDPTRWLWSEVDRHRARTSLRYMIAPKSRRKSLRDLIGQFRDQLGGSL